MSRSQPDAQTLSSTPSVPFPYDMKLNGEQGSWFAKWYALCMSEQIAVRLTDRASAALQELIDSGGFQNKAEAVRAAIEELAHRRRRERIGQEIAAGYRRHPQTDDEVTQATTAAIASIEEEPW